MVNYDTIHSKAEYKYFFKVFYNSTNKKKYNFQIQQHNICHTNIIAIKNMIVAAEKGKKNREPLAIENANKTVMAKFAKVSSTINLFNKYNEAISNADIDLAGDLVLTDIKKYQRYAGQIQNKVDGLYKGWISVLRAFVKYSRRMHIIEKVTENGMTRCEIDPKWALSLFIQ